MSAPPVTERTVLLVEDDRFLRRACETSLRRRGLSVATAVDGEEALRMIRGQRPALILLDLLMPRMSGLELLRTLRSDPATREARVVVLSNSSSARDLMEIAALGVDGYLVKANLSLRDLAEHVAALLETPR
jgi:CheY-like chemotaxis protein